MNLRDASARRTENRLMRWPGCRSSVTPREPRHEALNAPGFRGVLNMNASGRSPTHGRRHDRGVVSGGDGMLNRPGKVAGSNL